MSDAAGKNPCTKANRGGLSYHGFCAAQSASRITMTARCAGDFEFFNVLGSTFKPTSGASIKESRTAASVASLSDAVAYRPQPGFPAGPSVRELLRRGVSCFTW